MPQDSVLGPLLFILHTSELYHIVGNHIVSYADDAVIPRPLSRPQVIESLNQKLAAIDSWCLKWRMRFKETVHSQYGKIVYFCIKMENSSSCTHCEKVTSLRSVKRSQKTG